MVFRRDGTVVVDSSEFAPGRAMEAALDLSEGTHQLEVVYAWAGEFGVMEAFWVPAGAWLPGTIPEPREIEGLSGVRSVPGVHVAAARILH